MRDEKVDQHVKKASIDAMKIISNAYQDLAKQGVSNHDLGFLFFNVATNVGSLCCGMISKLTAATEAQAIEMLKEGVETSLSNFNKYTKNQNNEKTTTVEA